MLRRVFGCPCVVSIVSRLGRCQRVPESAVVAPLLALFFADGARIATAVAPRSLIEMTRNVYRSQFSAPVVLRPVFTLEFQRTTQVTTALVRRLEFARDARAVVVAAPSSIKAFVLKYIELQHASLQEKMELESQSSGQGFFEKVKDVALGDSRRRVAELKRRESARERESELYADAFALLHNGVALLDEVDLLLHPLKSELNWPSGEPEPLDFTAPSNDGTTKTGTRWRIPWFLLDAVLVASGSSSGLVAELAQVHTTSAASDLADAIRRGFEAKTLQAVPHLVLLDRKFYDTEMLPHLAEMLVSTFFEAEGVLRGLGGSATKEARQYVADDQIQSTTRVGQLPDEQVKYFNLGRGWLRTYMPWVLSKVNRVGFGTLSPDQMRPGEPRGRKFLAVPFVGKDKPTEASEFSNPEVAIGLTILSLRSAAVPCVEQKTRARIALFDANADH